MSMENREVFVQDVRNLYQKILEAYITVLSIHIDTKTKDALFHEKTEEVYTTLFESAHQFWERMVDYDISLKDASLEDQKKEVLDILSNTKKEIEAFYSKYNSSLPLGVQDLLWGIASDIEHVWGTSKSFLPK